MDSYQAGLEQWKQQPKDDIIKKDQRYTSAIKYISGLQSSVTERLKMAKFQDNDHYVTFLKNERRNLDYILSVMTKEE